VCKGDVGVHDELKGWEDIGREVDKLARHDYMDF